MNNGWPPSGTYGKWMRRHLDAKELFGTFGINFQNVKTFEQLIKNN